MIEIACREREYCLIPLILVETEFCTFFVNKRAASKYLSDQFSLLLETIYWAKNLLSALVKDRT